MPLKTLLDCWHADDGARQQALERARRCAALTKPPALPPQDFDGQQALPEPFQSLGAMIVTALEGKMLTALFPPGHPWFQLQASPSVRYDASIPDQDKIAFDRVLFLRELLVTGLLESASSSGASRPSRRRRSQPFRSAMRQHLSQAIVTGQACTRMHDDFRFQVLRRDRFVMKRDTTGDVLRITMRDRIDPLELPEAHRRTAELDEDRLLGMDQAERMMDLITQTQWQPLTQTWLVRSELNKQMITEREEKVSSFIETPYDLTCGDDEGRGFVELRLGALQSIDTLEEKMLDFAAILSDIKYVLDTGCLVQDQDLAGKSGAIVRNAQVSAGVVQNMAVMQANKSGDYAAVKAHLDSLKGDFAGNIATHASTTPRGDRVTAAQVRIVAQEVEDATAGLFVPLADSLQRPLTELAINRAEAQALMAPIPDELEEIFLLTGLTAVAGMVKKASLLELNEAATMAGPQALARINQGVWLDAFARHSAIYEPGLIKSDEQVQAEQEAALKQAAAARGAEEAIGVAGDAARAAIPAAA